ncbi:MAG: DegT/DnrJ/EryC1/StrS family aminotransferase, partial [Lachnospiraceae bacterium]
MSEKILVTKASLPPMEEYMEEIKSIWETHWLTNMGEKHKTLQKQLKEFMDVEYVELTVNGHMALELTLQALDLTGEVITTPFTFASTTHAIVRNGLTPVFCDIRTDDYTIDADKIESLITSKTTAIMPVHVYGNVCEVEKIQKIADKHGLKVIYDAAHTFGETYRGTGIGNFGDASCFSFHATKVFNTIEGGAVCYHTPELGETLYNLKNFGIRGTERVDGVGANAKMNEFQAAMGICNLRHLKENLESRKRVVKQYQERLYGIPGITVWKEQKEVESNYAYFPILVDAKRYGMNRDELFMCLTEQGIYARKYFYPLTNTFECFRGKFDAGKTPAALEISKK